MKRRKHRLAGAAAAVVLLVGIVAAAGALAAGPGGWTIVAKGFDSPRGLAFAPNGALYVGEAGHGGDVCSPEACLGLTSQISAIDVATGAHAPVVAGLISFNDLVHGGVTGVDGVSTDGGRILGIITGYPQAVPSDSVCAAGPPDCRAVLAAARAQLGTLIKATPSGTWKTLAGVGAIDFQWTIEHQGPDQVETDANPYGVLGVPAGAYVADAGSNTLDFVSANGATTVLAHFPNPPAGTFFPSDAVPTCVAIAGGTVYVADLSGRLWKVDGSTPTQVPVAPGLLRHVTGCTADAAGDLYLVNIFTTPFPSPGTGSVVKLGADGSASVLASPLNFPNGIALGPDGGVYVSVNSVCPATGPCQGQVIRLASS
jgi:hypothetical protein